MGRAPRRPPIAVVCLGALIALTGCQGQDTDKDATGQVAQPTTTPSPEATETELAATTQPGPSPTETDTPTDTQEPTVNPGPTASEEPTKPEQPTQERAYPDDAAEYVRTFVNAWHDQDHETLDAYGPGGTAVAARCFSADDSVWEWSSGAEYTVPDHDPVWLIVLPSRNSGNTLWFSLDIEDLGDAGAIKTVDLMVEQGRDMTFRPDDCLVTDLQEALAAWHEGDPSVFAELASPEVEAQMDAIEGLGLTAQPGTVAGLLSTGPDPADYLTPDQDSLTVHMSFPDTEAQTYTFTFDTTLAGGSGAGSLVEFGSSPVGWHSRFP